MYYRKPRSWVSSFYYQIAISCFLEDIDPIFKIYKKQLDESSWFVGARLVYNSKNFDFGKSKFPF